MKNFHDPEVTGYDKNTFKKPLYRTLLERTGKFQKTGSEHCCHV